MFGVVLQFLAIFMLTNNAAEEIYGKFSFLNSILIVVGALCLLGMNNSFLQFSGKLQAENKFSFLKTLYRKNVVILAMVYLALVAVYILIAYVLDFTYFKDSIKNIYNYIFLALLPYSLSILNFQVLRGINLLFMSEFSSNVFRYGGLFLLVFLLWYFQSFDLLIKCYVILFWVLSIITTTIIIFHLSKLELTKQINLDELSYKKIIRISFPMSFSLISLLIMQSFDVFIIERYLSFEYVAFYSSAIKITTGIGLILTTINSVIAPDLSKLFFSRRQEELKKLIEESTMLNFYLTVPLVFLVYIFSGDILNLFGPNYTQATLALKIMVVAQVLNAFCGSVGYYLNMTGKENAYLKMLLLALALNIVLNLLLIPKYGIEGAATATGLSLILWNFIGVIYIYKKDKIGVFIFSKKILRLLSN